jgi:peptidoglycan/xylan/chitin deacetylase (PgdA/CDA1 family)
MRSPDGPRILIYHQVGTDHGRQMEVTLEAFSKQMEWLVHHREVVDIETALQRWDEPGSDELVVLTFDDGYRDVYTTAFPILRNLGFPIVLYLSTSLVGDPDEVGGELDDEPLSWAEVIEMQKSGLLVVGAHTHTHPDLRSLTVREVEDELDRSDGIITRELGATPRHFAYPYGFWSAQADPPIRQRYETAVLGGSPRPLSSPEPHLLHRYPVQLSDGFVWFEKRLTGGFRLEEAVRKRVKGYDGP